MGVEADGYAWWLGIPRGYDLDYEIHVVRHSPEGDHASKVHHRPEEHS